MKRRDFIKYTSLMAAGTLCPSVFARRPARNSPRLILIELKGGNDGLNTLVPYKNPDYKRIRKKIHLEAKDVNVINERLGLGLHKKLQFMHSQFEKKQVAIFHSVGYESPNMSHFRGIDIWDTAVDSTASKSTGWIAEALKGDVGTSAKSKGIILGDHNLGPLRGTKQSILVVDNIKKMLRSRKLFEEHEDRKNPALNHILEIENQVLEQLNDLSQINFEPKKKSGFQADVNILLQLVKARPEIPFYKLSLGSFDTHAAQLNRHANLLGTFDNGLKTLVEGLRSLNAWDDTLILTYSEFGRRPMENGNQGTDHGTASCHFALGGKVKGSIYHGADGKAGGGKAGLGAYDLAEIKSTNQNLTAKMDFKDIYETVLTKWWKTRSLGSDRKAIDFLKV